MTEENKQPDGEEPRKISLAEASKLMLEKKKQAQANQAGKAGSYQNNQAGPKSQKAKKTNNQRRRTGV